MRVDGDQIITAVLAIIFCAAGTALIVLGWNIVQDAQASAAWPGVPGMVRESSVDSATDSDGHTTYAPQVRFTYAINGRPYEGHTIHFGETSYSSPTAAQAAANRYPQGQPVTVYFDPAHPEKAVLETGMNVGSYLVLAVGVLFLGMALLMGVQVALTVLLQRQTP